MIEVRVIDGRSGGMLQRHVRVGITQHAIHRYIERVEPHLDYDQAAKRIVEQLRGMAIRKKRPGWAGHVAGMKHRILTDGYLVVKDRCAFPLTLCKGGLRATTCLARDG